MTKEEQAAIDKAFMAVEAALEYLDDAPLLPSLREAYFNHLEPALELIGEHKSDAVYADAVFVTGKPLDKAGSREIAMMQLRKGEE